ncbi:MAG: cupin domain-containing protein [Clostridia bacterium]|nr:cupin domain-containing protein [Clostridia bacterium]
MQFMTPPNHIGFKAVKLFGESGKIIDGAVAYLEPNGGGPVEKHTHFHNHLFSVLEGEAKIVVGEQFVILKQGESFLVDGTIPHSVWNNCEKQTVMLGISVL